MPTAQPPPAARGLRELSIRLSYTIVECRRTVQRDLCHARVHASVVRVHLLLVLLDHAELHQQGPARQQCELCHAPPALRTWHSELEDCRWLQGAQCRQEPPQGVGCWRK